MKLTENVIKDLLILYQAGEASADTIEIVEEYLKDRPELAHWIKQPMVLAEAPSLSDDVKMKSFRKMRRTWGVRIALVALALAVLLTGLLTFGDWS